jgi:peptidoglycan/LPS O-acetylase OafA/YrhL
LEQRDIGQGGRFASIDVLRGIAIAWVVLFHLWGDIEFFPAAPRLYYEQLVERAGEGNPLATFTAFTDVLFRIGFQGVPLFMMISGVSLTIAAYRAGDGLSWVRFFWQRFRKLLVPYWAGVALTYGVIAGIAWHQAATGAGPFTDRFGHGITISEHTVVLIDRGVIWASITLIPRLLQDEWFFAPQLALWFVGLLAQYYLLFPILFVVMRRIGVVAFVLSSFALTVAANAWAVHEYAALELKFFLVTGWAPFRLFEFTAGMAVGWLLIDPRARRTLDALRHPAITCALLAGGLAVHTCGDLLIGWWTGEQVVERSRVLYLQSLALPLVTLGLAMMALPLLAKRPSRVDASVPLRALALVGVMSYALLIVSDAMRLVASEMRASDVPGAVWWTFVVCVYVPLNVAIAWPLSHLLGLMPKRASPARETVPAPPTTESAEEPLRLAPERV